MPPLSRALSLSSLLSRFGSARTLLDKIKNKRGRLNKNLVRQAALPLSRAAFALSLPLLCCLSRAASRPCALRSCPQTGANDRGRARRSRNARAPLWPTTLDAPGEGAPGTHGGRGSDDGTLLCFGKGAGKGGGKGGGCGKGSGRGKGGERRSGARTPHVHMHRAVTLVKNCRPYSGP